MSVLRRAKLRTPDGTESIEYPLGVEAENVEVANGENLSQRLVRIDEDLNENKEDITAVNELAGINKQNIGQVEIRVDALEERNVSAKDILFNNGYNIQETIGNIDIHTDGTVENQLADLKNTKKNFMSCYLGLRKRLITGTTYGLTLQYSIDGIHFIDIKNLPDTVTCGQNNSISLCKIRDYWYIFRNNDYYYSKDFINWSSLQNFTDIPSNVLLWCSYLYDFGDRVELFYALCLDRNVIATDVTGGSTYYFTIRHKEVSITNGQIENFDYNTASTVLGDGNTTSYIDPNVCEFNNEIYLVCKDEINKIIKLYKKEGDNYVDTGFTHAGIGIEAPKLISNGRELLIYADPYALMSKFNLEYGVLTYIMGRRFEIRTVAVDNKNAVSTNAMWDCVKGTYSYHIGYMKCDNYDDILLIKSIAELGYYEETEIISRTGTISILYSDIPSDIETGYRRIALINHPSAVQSILGNSWGNRIYLSFEQVFNDVNYVLFKPGDPRPSYYAGKNINSHTTDDFIDNKRLDFKDYSLLSYPIEKATGRNKQGMIKIKYEEYPIIFRDSTTTTSYDIILNENIDDERFRYASLIIGGTTSNLSYIPLILNNQQIIISNNNNNFAQDLKIIWIDTAIGKLRITTENGGTQFYGGYSLSYYGK